MPQTPYVFSDFFTRGQYETEIETRTVDNHSRNLTIGVAREVILDERRVALVPHSIRTLVGYGHKVVVESGAGTHAGYADLHFSEAGALISYSRKEVFESQVLVKVAPPTLEEIEMMHPDQVLISPLQLPVLPDDYLERLRMKRITSLAMEYLQSDDGDYPMVRTMSEIIGSCAILTGAEYLSHQGHMGRGVLLGGVSGVPPTKIVVLGAGHAAESAIRVALGLGASVRVFDNDVTRLMHLQQLVGRHLHTSTLNPVYLAYQLTSADLVIGAIHSRSGRAPIVVTEEMVSKMKPGAVIVDLSIDQGGCIETSRMTTLTDPYFVRHDVIHYCVPNIASKVSRTGSQAVSNILTSLLLKLGNEGSADNLLYNYKGIRYGCYTYKGAITHEYLSKRFGLKYTSLELLLTSKL
jgi:alanine dehydrogenase